MRLKILFLHGGEHTRCMQGEMIAEGDVFHVR